MLRETTNFNAIDLLASLGINKFATKAATADDSFRLSLYKDPSGDVPAVVDLRFIGGCVSVIYAQYYAKSEQLKRVAHDLSLGLFSSFVATESCRAAAVKRMIQNGSNRGSTNYSGDSDLMDSEEDYNDPNLEDIYGGDLSPESEFVSYAYGW